ncbi:hypothetical protein BC567DRAFT_51729 [Phyllosticta citribraziliensis]
MTPIQHRHQRTRAPRRAPSCWARASPNRSRCRYCLAATAAAMSKPRRKGNCTPTKPVTAAS